MPLRQINNQNHNHVRSTKNSVLNDHLYGQNQNSFIKMNKSTSNSVIMKENNGASSIIANRYQNNTVIAIERDKNKEKLNQILGLHLAYKKGQPGINLEKCRVL